MIPDPSTEPDAEHPVIPWLTRPRRLWLYSVVGTLVPLLTVVAAAQSSLWAALGAVALSLIGTGITIPNTSTAPL